MWHNIDPAPLQLQDCATATPPVTHPCWPVAHQLPPVCRIENESTAHRVLSGGDLGSSWRCKASRSHHSDDHSVEHPGHLEYSDVRPAGHRKCKNKQQRSSRTVRTRVRGQDQATTVSCGNTAVRSWIRQNVVTNNSVRIICNSSQKNKWLLSHLENCEVSTRPSAS